MPKVTVVAALVVTKVGVGGPKERRGRPHQPASVLIGLPNWSMNDGAGNFWLAPLTVSGLPVTLPVSVCTTVTFTLLVTEVRACRRSSP